MSVYLITFTDARMTTSAAKLKESAFKHGVDYADIYFPSDLPQWFTDHHKELLKQERGYGFYCWKPFLISYAINQMKDGDYLIWADAGQQLVNSVKPVIESMNSDIFLFSNGWPHVEWCKGDVLQTILGWGNIREEQTKCGTITTQSWLPWVKDFKQVQASLIFFRVSKQSKDFCKEWLAWSLLPGLVDNEPSKVPNFPTFAEHRWDQAILACMQIKYSIPLHWFPSTTAHHIRQEYIGDHYNEITLHHRKRNSEW